MCQRCCYWVNKRRRELAAKRRLLATYVNALKPEQWAETLEYFGYACAYCLRTDVKLEREHVLAITRGGEHTPENVIPCCTSCNSRKHDRPIFWMATVLGVEGGRAIEEDTLIVPWHAALLAGEMARAELREREIEHPLERWKSWLLDACPSCGLPKTVGPCLVCEVKDDPTSAARAGHRCAKCGGTGPFYRNRSRASGWFHRCKACCKDPAWVAKQRKRAKSYYEKHKADPKWAAKQRERSRRHYEKRKADPEWMAKERERQTRRDYAPLRDVLRVTTPSASRDRDRDARKKVILAPHRCARCGGAVYVNRAPKSGSEWCRACRWEDEKAKRLAARALREQKAKRRERKKRDWQKHKADPQWLAKEHERTRLLREKQTADPTYRAKKRERDSRRYETNRADPEWVAKERARERRRYAERKAADDARMTLVLLTLAEIVGAMTDGRIAWHRQRLDAIGSVYRETPDGAEIIVDMAALNRRIDAAQAELGTHAA